MPNPVEPDFSDAPPKRLTIVIWLALTALLLTTIITFLCYRALTTHVPKGSLQIAGTESWADANALLTAESGTPKYETRLDAIGRYSATFFVNPGRYRIQIRRDGMTLFEQWVEIMRGKPESIVLPAEAPPAPAPSTDPAP